MIITNGGLSACAFFLSLKYAHAHFPGNRKMRTRITPIGYGNSSSTTIDQQGFRVFYGPIYNKFLNLHEFYYYS